MVRIWFSLAKWQCDLHNIAQIICCEAKGSRHRIGAWVNLSISRKSQLNKWMNKHYCYVENVISNALTYGHSICTVHKWQVHLICWMLCNIICYPIEKSSVLFTDQLLLYNMIRWFVKGDTICFVDLLNAVQYDHLFICLNDIHIICWPVGFCMIWCFDLFSAVHYDLLIYWILYIMIWWYAEFCTILSIGQLNPLWHDLLICGIIDNMICWTA
jgi:hypothetical protein